MCQCAKKCKEKEMEKMEMIGRNYDFSQDMELLERIVKRVTGGFVTFGGSSPVLQYPADVRKDEDALQECRALAFQGIKGFAKKWFLEPEHLSAEQAAEHMFEKKHHCYYLVSMGITPKFCKYLGERLTTLNGLILDGIFSQYEEKNGSLLYLLEDREADISFDIVSLKMEMSAILSKKQFEVFLCLLAGDRPKAARETVTRVRRYVYDRLLKQ